MKVCRKQFRNEEITSGPTMKGAPLNSGRLSPLFFIGNCHSSVGMVHSEHQDGLLEFNSKSAQVIDRTR